jgi:hypothetical protein
LSSNNDLSPFTLLTVALPTMFEHLGALGEDIWAAKMWEPEAVGKQGMFWAAFGLAWGGR